MTIIHRVWHFIKIFSVPQKVLHLRYFHIKWVVLKYADKFYNKIILTSQYLLNGFFIYKVRSFHWYTHLLSIVVINLYWYIKKLPVLHFNNAVINIIDVPVKDKFVDILNYSYSIYIWKYSCFIPFKIFPIVPLYHKLVT